MRIRLVSTLLVVGCELAAAAALALPAFPGAEGYGANTVGGRGGTVYVVRSLCDYDPVTQSPTVCGTSPTTGYQHTLRWAVEATGPRTVVFDVGGNIVLRHTLYIFENNSQLTIAGQTAPSPGITLSRCPTTDATCSARVGSNLIEIESGHDIILRHLRLRGGAGLGQWDNHTIFANAWGAGGHQPYNIIVDHVSTSWATDDMVAFQDARDVTVQWSIISEALMVYDQLPAFDQALCQAGIAGCGTWPNACVSCTQNISGVGKALLVDSTPAQNYTGRVSIHHNLIAHNWARTPAFSAGALASVADQSWPVEVVNNVIHDYGAFGINTSDGNCASGAATCPAGHSCLCVTPWQPNWRRTRANVIGNTLSQSAATISNTAWIPAGDRWLPLNHPSDPGGPWKPRELLLEFLEAIWGDVPVSVAPMQLYSDDNRSWRRDASNVEAGAPVTDDALPLCTQQTNYYAVPNCVLSSYFVANPHAMATNAAPITIQPSEDAEVDVLDGAGALYRDQDPVDQRAVDDSVSHDGTLMTTANPSLPSITPSARPAGYDADSDGMPDAWESTYGVTAQNLDADGDGYTNLEEYLNGTHPFDSDNDGVANPAEKLIFLSFDAATTLPGVGSVADEDVVSYDVNSNRYDLYFDGSDVGLSGAALDGFTRLANGDLLLSIKVNGTISGLIGGPSGNNVEDRDIVRFVPTSLGANLAGSFNFYFDGSDVGLDFSGEDIDAIGVDNSGKLLISILESGSIAGAPSVEDEDVVVFTATSLGSVTAGSFSMYFDGSDVTLSNGADEDVDGVFLGSDGRLYLSTLGNCPVTGVSGADEDILRFTPTSTGSNTAGSYSLYLDGTNVGMPSVPT